MMRFLSDIAVEPNPAGKSSVASVLHLGLEIVDDLHTKLTNLDEVLLTGQPTQISEAALAVETSLQQAKPAFSDIASAIRDLGASNLEAAAREWRMADDENAASLADSLRQALSRFANRSVGASRRARQLNNGLTTALRSLHSYGVHESGRLIAEA